MKEIRKYRQYFKEEPSILRPGNNLYWLTLEFDFDSKHGQLTIPDCGGQVDMVPKSGQQQDWVIDLMDELEHKRVWATVWEFSKQEVYEAILKALDQFGAELKHLDTKLKD